MFHGCSFGFGFLLKPSIEGNHFIIFVMLFVQLRKPTGSADGGHQRRAKWIVNGSGFPAASHLFHPLLIELMVTRLASASPLTFTDLTP